MIADIWFHFCYDQDLLVCKSESGEKQLKILGGKNTFLNLNNFYTSEHCWLFWNPKTTPSSRNELIKPNVSWKDYDPGSNFPITFNFRKFPLVVLNQKPRYSYPGFSHRVFVFKPGELEKLLEETAREFTNLLVARDIPVNPEMIYHTIYLVHPDHRGD